MAQEDRYVLHTSVLVKWFRPGEVLAARALALRDAYLAGQIAVTVPTPAAYELANVLRYKADLTTDPVGAGWDWVAPSPVAMGQAIDIARTYDVTVYDAVFAALAESLGATMITGDERLVQRLTAVVAVRFLGEVSQHRRPHPSRAA